MNEHFDPTFDEAMADARRYGWRAWLVFATGVVVAVMVLWLFDPALAVAATVAGVALAVFAHPNSRAVARVVFRAVVLLGMALLVIVALARKDARL